jgi:hypothetical protein
MVLGQSSTAATDDGLNNSQSDIQQQIEHLLTCTYSLS